LQFSKIIRKKLFKGKGKEKKLLWAVIVYIYIYIFTMVTPLVLMRRTCEEWKEIMSGKKDFLAKLDC